MKLKEFRSRIGLTQKQLAEQMNTTQQTVARWETGKTILNVDQIRDLCVVLECTADELLGWETGAEGLMSSPFSSVGSEGAYGTLHIKTTCGTREYPIGLNARKTLLSQAEATGPINANNSSDWLSTWSLNNRLLLINPSYLRGFQLISDDVEAMPSFEHPEVYRALENWPDIKAKGKTWEQCQNLVSRLEDEQAVSRLVSQVRITYEDGTDDWCLLSDETATTWFELGMASPSVGQNSFVKIDKEGGEVATFANLGRVVMIEIPTDLYLRLISD
ncbi:helix-turn-helix transcriptional regulator [uncultured Roseovarius sp.]|uniref:helix-turn-helix transcriptional regulator n=1 Tax=uncultured Roseovarius sp. TaxID=293344 RepID=UPI0025E84F38|nr:helix-turn-helix transcriptional regulator [uncultured Roseovarius sp.]